MIISPSTYVLKIIIQKIFEKGIKISAKNNTIISNSFMSMVDILVIYVETPRRDNGRFLEKELSKLIYMNPWVVLYLIVKSHCVCDLLTWDTYRSKIMIVENISLLIKKHYIQLFKFDLKFFNSGISRLNP